MTTKFNTTEKRLYRF